MPYSISNGKHDLLINTAYFKLNIDKIMAIRLVDKVINLYAKDSVFIFHIFGF